MGKGQETVTRRLESATTDEEVAEIGVQLLDRIFEATASVVAVTRDGSVVHRAKSPGGSVEGAGALLGQPGCLDHAIDCGTSRILDDLGETRSAAAAGEADGTDGAALFVPIEGDGAILVVDDDPGWFDRRDLAVAELVAEILVPHLSDDRRPVGPSSPADRLEAVAKVLSHDLSNPLQIARSWVERAIETGETDRLEDALHALERVDELTSGAAQYARTGRPIDEPERVDLDAVARSAWTVVEGEDVDAGDVELDVLGSASFLADGSRLVQLLENLFANAVVHGSPPVTVRVGPLDDGIGFFVEDDGDGIPASKRGTVLEYGYSTREDRSGYGLGIVAGIVDAHGWTIDVGESAEGGARFEVIGVEPA